MLRKFLFFTLLAGCAYRSMAQDSLRCQDVVYMKGGSVFRGTISNYDLSGTLTMTTWSGSKMEIPSNAVRRVIQDCKDSKQQQRGERAYNFRERGWYHSTRFSGLFGYSGLGYSLQHSSGFQMNRFWGIGAGIGVENFGPDNLDPVIMPLFVESRCYLAKKRIAPFVSLAAGFSPVIGEQQVVDWWGGDNNVTKWYGGWLAQGHIGYRIGNHFITFVGIRYQHLKYDWDNTVWGAGKGTDIHLKKRIQVGIGLLI